MTSPEDPPREQLPCPDCGYDLRGNLPDDREQLVTCSECGHQCSLRALEEANRERLKPQKAGCGWIALALVPGALLVGTEWVAEEFGASWEDGVGIAMLLIVATGRQSDY